MLLQEKKTPYQDKKKFQIFQKKKFPAQFFLLLISILPSDSKKPKTRKIKNKMKKKIWKKKIWKNYPIFRNKFYLNGACSLCVNYYL